MDFSAASGMWLDNVMASSSPSVDCAGYPLISAFAPPGVRITTYLFWMEKLRVRLKVRFGRESPSAIVLPAVEPP